MSGKTVRWGQLSPEELAGANYALRVVRGINSLNGTAKASVETMIEETGSLLRGARGLTPPEGDAGRHANVPLGYATSVSAALRLSPERLDDLATWMAVHVLPACPRVSDVIDMINAGRGVEDLSPIEKLLLAFYYGAFRAESSREPPAGVRVVFWGRFP